MLFAGEELRPCPSGEVALGSRPRVALSSTLNLSRVFLACNVTLRLIPILATQP